MKPKSCREVLKRQCVRDKRNYNCGEGWNEVNNERVLDCGGRAKRRHRFLAVLLLLLLN